MVSSETLPSSESSKHFARKLFCELHQSIIQHETRAIEGNVEAIHNMRVGIRRLRVAISNFAICLDKNDRRRLRINMENLANALGGVRDLDVMIAALKISQINFPGEDRAVIGAFIGRLRERRRKRLRELVAYLRGEEYAAFKNEFSSPGDD